MVKSCIHKKNLSKLSLLSTWDWVVKTTLSMIFFLHFNWNNLTHRFSFCFEENKKKQFVLKDFILWQKYYQFLRASAVYWEGASIFHTHEVSFQMYSFFSSSFTIYLYQINEFFYFFTYNVRVKLFLKQA